jgi:hypothetical protein
LTGLSQKIETIRREANYVEAVLHAQISASLASDYHSARTPAMAPC